MGLRQGREGGAGLRPGPVGVHVRPCGGPQGQGAGRGGQMGGFEGGVSGKPAGYIPRVSREGWPDGLISIGLGWAG